MNLAQKAKWDLSPIAYTHKTVGGLLCPSGVAPQCPLWKSRALGIRWRDCEMNSGFLDWRKTQGRQRKDSNLSPKQCEMQAEKGPSWFTKL